MFTWKSPFTLNEHEARKLTALADERGLKVTAGHDIQFRHQRDACACSSRAVFWIAVRSISRANTAMERFSVTSDLGFASCGETY
jgi:hypothetical protein